MSESTINNDASSGGQVITVKGKGVFNDQSTNHINTSYIMFRLVEEWSRPNESDPSGLRFQRTVVRQRQLQRLGDLLACSPRPGVVGVVGMPGLGKSTLASLYISSYDQHYPGGTLWVTVGHGFNPGERIRPILDGWASYAYGSDIEQLRQTEQWRSMLPSPDKIRSLLGGHGRLLVVLDDVWDKPTLDALIDIIPREADLLVTTRHSSVVQHLQHTLALELLDPDELAELAHLHRVAIPDEQLQALGVRFGHYVLALSVALGEIAKAATPAAQQDTARALLRQPDTPLPEAIDQSRLHTDQAIPQAYVALGFSYNAIGTDPKLGPDYQRRLRWLGVLSSAGFNTEIASGLWGTTVAEAAGTLQALCDRSLLSGHPQEGQWQLHAVVREYLRAELRQSGEQETARRAYVAQIQTLLSRLSEGPAGWAAVAPQIGHVQHLAAELIGAAQAATGQDFSCPKPLAALGRPSDEQRTALADLMAFANATANYTLIHSQASESGRVWITAGVQAARLLGSYADAANLLLLLGRWHLQRSQSTEALAALQQGQDLAEQHLLAATLIELRVALGTANSLKGHPEVALEIFHEALADYERHGIDHPELKALVLSSLSDLYIWMEQFDKAMEHMQDLLPIAEASDNESLRLAVHQQIGMLAVSSGNPYQALSFFEKAKPSIERLGDKRSGAALLNNIGVAHLMMGDIDTAQGCFDEVAQMLETINYPQLRANLMMNYASISRAKDDPQRALDHLLKARAICEAIGDIPQLARALGLLGVAHNALGNSVEALALLNQALPQLVKTRSTSVSVMVLNTLGTIYRRTGQTQAGIEFFRAQLPVFEHIESSGSVVTILNWLALLLQDSGNGEQALRFFEQAERIIDTIEDPLERATAHSLMGDMCSELGQLRKAHEIFAGVLKQWEQSNDDQRRAETLVRLVAVNLKLSEAEVANTYLDQLEQLAEQSNNVLLKVAYLNLRGHSCLLSAKIDAALGFFERTAEQSVEIDMPVLHVSSAINLSLCRLFLGQIDSARQGFEEALKLTQKLAQEDHELYGYEAAIMVNLGLVASLGNDELDTGCAYIERAIKILEEHDLSVDAAGVSIDLLRVVLDFMGTVKGSNKRSPREVLSLLIRSTSWETAELIVKTNGYLFDQDGVDAVLQREIATAEEGHNDLLAQILRIYRSVLQQAKNRTTAEAFSSAKTLSDNQIMHYWWAMLHRSANAYQQALTNINRAIEIAPNRAEQHIERGWVLRGLGNYTGALSDFQQALRLNQHDPFAHQGLGVVAFELGRPDTALQHLTSAIGALADPYSYQWRAAVYQRAGDLGSALADLTAAANLDPDNTDHAYWRALILLEQGDATTALGIFDRIFELDKGDRVKQSYDALWRSVALELLKNPRGAASERAHALGLLKDDNSIGASLCRALLQVVSSEVPIARRSYEQVLKRGSARRHALETQIQHLRLLARLVGPRESVGGLADWLSQEISEKTPSRQPGRQTEMAA